MNQIVATIKNIRSVDNLNIVDFDFDGIELKMMSLGLNKDVEISKKVKLSVKPTNIFLSKDISTNMSISNKIVATIDSIENGQLLSSIILKVGDIFLESIITVDSSKRMNLQKNDELAILIKASDLFIEEIL